MTLLNLTINQGEFYTNRLTGVDSAGNALNLTNHSASGFIRHQYGSSGVLFNLNPSIHSSYVSGLIDLNLNATGTAGLPVGKFVYDIEVFSGNVTGAFKVFKGVVSVNPEVTY
jgi:hypothetical protein